MLLAVRLIVPLRGNFPILLVSTFLQHLGTAVWSCRLAGFRPSWLRLVLLASATGVGSPVANAQIQPATLAAIGVELKSSVAVAKTPSEQGRLIALAADTHDSGYVDLQVDLEMLLRSTGGRSTARELSIRQLEVPEDGDKLLVVFSTPKSVKGTALLSYAHKQGQDDQWLYLPAIKRVKKITSKNRSGPFLSSEFAFEDLTPQEVDKYGYKLLRTAPCKAGTCYVLQRIAKDPNTGYSRQEQWLDEEHLLTQKIDYFDRRGDLLKTLEVSDYQLFDEQHWKALSLIMSNHRTGKSTELRWRNYRFATGLDADRDFSANSLRRVR